MMTATMQRAGHLDAATVKQAAAGYWREILTSVAGIPAELLDGRGHPCPSCGGTDRFAAFGDVAETGGVLCRHCHATNNGDGLAAVQWALGVSFGDALRLVAEYLNVSASAHSTRSRGISESVDADTPSTPKNAAASRSRIVAEYDYRDSDGELIFQAVRLEPKDFRQRRPDGNGGWSWSVKGVAPLPYRLPELLRADSDKPVFVVEGEKDVDALESIDCVAMCNAGGAGKWKPGHAEHLAGRHVVILPDNDDPGRKHGQQVAQSLVGVARSVKMVELPGLPEKGDASDWIDGHGDAATPEIIRENLLALVEAADEWRAGVEDSGEAPVEPPLRYQPFPTHLLPAAMRAFVEEAAAAVGCDAALVALPALAAAAGAIGATRTVRLKSTWREPAVLWCVVVSPSGAMKSQGRQLVLQPILRRQQQALAEHAEAMAAFGPLQTAYEKDLAAWKRSKSNEPPPEAPDPPVLKELLISDTTVEAVAKALRANPRGLLLDRDELAAWFGSFDAYKSGKGSDAQSWMNTHGAGYLKVNRSSNTAGPLFVRRACVSVCGTIQPGIISRMLDSDHRESGFAARLLIANPPRRAKRWTDDDVSERTQTAFSEAMLALLDLGFGEDDDGEPAPIPLRLTPSARRRFARFVNEHGAEALDRHGAEAAAWAKLEGYAARLALVMTLFDNPVASEIDDRALARAIDLVGWFAHEAARFYSGARETGEDRELTELAEWIDTKHGGTVTARQVVQGRWAIKTTAAAEALLDRLAKAGFGDWQVATTATNQRREFALASSSTSTDSPETREIAESVDVDAPPTPENTPSTAPDGDGWEAA